MRKAMVVMVGIVTVLGFVVGSPHSEALDSCALNGSYSLSALGEAAGFLELMGIVNFTPNAGCTGGDFTANLTIKRQGGAGAPIVPPITGTYFVVPNTSGFSLTVPGVIGLTGLLSQRAGGIANAFNFVARFEQEEPIVLAGSAFRQSVSSDLVSGVVSEVEIVSNQTSINVTNPKNILVDCPPGGGPNPNIKKVLGGGAEITGMPADVKLLKSIPAPFGGTQWTASAFKQILPGDPNANAAWGLRVDAVCGRVQE